MEKKHYQSLPFARYFLSAFLLVFLFTPFTAEAADPGSLKGTITDKTDGEAVIGASAMLENTTLGSASDIEGNYAIQNIPAGTYRLKVNAIGYAPFIQSVTINPGQATTLNAQLGQTTVMASEIVVGAALYEQDRLEVPVTTSVVTNEEIKKEPNPSLDQVIEAVPGVNVTRSAGYSAATVQIRGSNTYQGGGIGTRVNAFYDGFPINSPATGGIVWTNVNMNAADKVEVVKGAASTLYGSAAMGGVVNVFGYLPDTFEVKAGVSGGFYDGTPDSDQSEYRMDYTPWFWNTYVGIGNKTDKLNYSLLYTHSEDDGYRDNSQTLLNDVKLKARFDIDSNQYLQLTSFYNQTEAGYVSTWPYDLVPGPGGAINFVPHPELAYDLVDDVYTDDIVKRKNALVGLNYVNLLSDDLSLDTRVYYTHNEYRIDYNPTGSTQYFPPFFSPFYIYERVPDEFNQNKTDRYGAGFKLDWRASDQHRLVFGVDGNLVDLASTQYRPDLPPDPAVPGIELGDVREKNLALFVQDEFKISEKLTALLTLRYDWSGIDAEEVTYFKYAWPPFLTTLETDPIENQSVDAISPRLAFNFKATDDLSFRASVGKSFRAPTLSERFVRDAGLFVGNPNPALDKENMTGYEIGFFKNFNDKVSLDVAAYLNEYEDLIESVNQNPIKFPVIFFYDNIATARIWGIETSLNIKPNPDWNIALSYAYMNAKNTSYVAGENPSLDANPDPEWLTYRPEHTASVALSWQAVERLNLYTNGRYVSEYKAVSTYTNPEGENYPGGFVVFDAGAKFQATDNIGISFLCKNITNEQYEEAEWFRAPGRSFLLGLDFIY